MSRSTISTFQLFALFPDEESARIYFEGRIWPSGPVCPNCVSQERVSALGACATRKPGFYRCAACAFDFTVRTGTVMERSKIPLHKWLYSMYLVVTARKGISSMQLASLDSYAAWFLRKWRMGISVGPSAAFDLLRRESLTMALPVTRNGR